MLVFGIDWLFSTILLTFLGFYLLPQYLLRLIVRELGQLHPAKLFSTIFGLEMQGLSMSSLLQQAIIQHIDLLLQKKNAFLATLIPNSLKVDLASQVADFVAAKIPWVFADQDERTKFLESRLRVAVMGFLRTRKWIILAWASLLGLILSTVHAGSVFLVSCLDD